MRKKIFKNMCLLALVTILLSSLLVTIVYYANSDARMKSEVREETRFVRGAVELSGQDYLATVENTANRITLIDTDGTVLYDNQADPATMENHSDREEFQEASTAGAGEATRIVNAERLRIKESDRLSTVTEVLSALGADIEEQADALVIRGKAKLPGGVTVSGHNDHRIAMMAAIAATRCEKPVTITGAECVKKSYPRFWEDYERLGGRLTRA